VERDEGEIGEKPPQTFLGPLKIDVMTKTVSERNVNSRLIRIKFPGVEIEHDGFAVAG